MTTKAAESLYLAQHNMSMEGKIGVCYNPKDLKIEQLPIIYIFGNTPPPWIEAYARAANGKVLGSHICSSEGYIKHDLGYFEGTREDRHKKCYERHYPDGYKMEYVPVDLILSHEGLKEAMKENQKLIPAADGKDG